MKQLLAARTIGSATSGGTERANAEADAAANLYKLLRVFHAFAGTQLPLVTNSGQIIQRIYVERSPCRRVRYDVNGEGNRA